MTQQNNVPWILPIGVRFLRAAWIKPHHPLYEHEQLQGFIVLETFDHKIRQLLIRVVEIRKQQHLFIDWVPAAEVFWSIPEIWNDEREYNREGIELHRTTRQCLFDLQVELKEENYAIHN